MKKNRENCPIRHPENGNCLCIGGFCTAVNDNICQGLRNAYEQGMTDQKEKMGNIRIMEFAVNRARWLPEEHMVAVFDNRQISDEEVSKKEDILSGMGHDDRIAVMTKAQFENIFRGGKPLEEDINEEVHNGEAQV